MYIEMFKFIFFILAYVITLGAFFKEKKTDKNRKVFYFRFLTFNSLATCTILEYVRRLSIYGEFKIHFSFGYFLLYLFVLIIKNNVNNGNE